MSAALRAPGTAGNGVPELGTGRGGKIGPWSSGPWLWGLRLDLAVFVGSAVVALGLVGLAPQLAGEGGALPVWGFIAFVIAIDVAHVYATLYRTYFDRAELARRPLLYSIVPLGCFVLGVALHSASSLLFWRILAYFALTHFVRQQVGWVAIYRARARQPRSTLDRVLDDAAIYASTLYPVLVWHASLPRRFEWFVDGDFASLPVAPLVAPARILYLIILGAYAARAIHRAWTTRVLELGKHLVVMTTALTWYVGIVATNSDFTFTAANVIVHGVPYLMLLYMFARQRGQETKNVVSTILRGGALVFVLVLQVLAFLEEMLWDRLVWHSHEGVFGTLLHERVLSPAVLAVLVPLLAVPQATHYVLDAVLWRRRDTGAAQARAMGFGN